MAKHIGIVSVNYEGTALCYRSICIEAVPHGRVSTPAGHDSFVSFC